MTVFKKLQAARLALVESGIKKTGKNSFHGWGYYELGDFIPAVHKLFDAAGLCGVVSFGSELATLTIYDTEDGTSVQFVTPVVMAENNKAQAIQNLGSTHSYIRRYLWLLAMEIVEADAIDALPQEEKPKSKPVATLPKTEAPATGKVPTKIEGREGPWNIAVSVDSTGDLQAWIGIVMDAARLALGATQSKEDVMNIFKVNRNIFDKLKVEAPEDYELLMAEFKTAKDKYGAK